MAYNVSRITKLSGSLVLPAHNVARARVLLASSEMSEGVLPRPVKGNKTDADVTLEPLNWTHDFSGRTWGYTLTHPDALFVRFIALTEGHADFLVIWEGGDSLTGLRIVDGRAIKCDVNISIRSC